MDDVRDTDGLYCECTGNIWHLYAVPGGGLLVRCANPECGQLFDSAPLMPWQPIP